MESYQVDLTNCDKEPIHIPGKVQTHGFLVAVDYETLIISFISENAISFVGKEAASFLGKPIETLENSFNADPAQSELKNLLKLLKNGKNTESVNPFQISINQKTYNLIVSVSDKQLILEFEPAASDLNSDIQKTIGKSVSGILSGKNLSSLLNNAAAEIKNIIQYDRVMIYKFNEDGHGRVVAEVKNDDLEPFLDLYYPATDIPKQARELYKINLTRIIADINSTSAPIITQNQNTALDLTHSVLRAVSPVHIQYLKNMGVASSFSISLMAKDELWGLVACHNYSPRFINYKARDAAKLIGQILSSALEYRQEEEDTEILRTLDQAAAEISKHIKEEDNLVHALTGNEITLKNLTNATGAVAILNNEIIRVGNTPDDEQIKELLIWLKAHLQDTVYYTNRLPELFLPAKKYSNMASGILACVISKELNEWLIWFKPEQIESITWAGNPQKTIEDNGDGLMQLSPRKSFDAWTEIVKNTSEKWSTKEVSVVIKVREEILDAINRKANEIRVLNDRLQLAYNELDTFTYTISHDLRTPLSAIKSYSELLVTTNKSLDDNAKKILDRIVAGADKMNFLIKEILNYSRVGRTDFELEQINMQALLTDIKQEVTAALQPQNLELTFGDLPNILGDKVMIGQVFTNLLNNAIKYSSQANPAKVKVEGVIKHNEIIYSVADNGVGIDINYYNRVFELFKRMDNVKEFEGTGVGLAIVKRIIEKHQARIWFESTLNVGTIFYLGFKTQSS
ncbi:MAG: GAF domain-containing protein [Sphingobacteriaceae bacterium]|nr:MAG: GAF domain-containing protein [Sphingobacteriaceae bacterium]